MKFPDYKRAALTAERARELFSYDPETGDLRWAKRLAFATKIGSIAGYVKTTGRNNINERKYLSVCVDGHDYLAHCLVWLITHGHFPDGLIDHIDRDSLNNRLCNLRLATKSQNGANRLMPYNKTGFKGVCLQKSGRYSAVVTKGGKGFYAGMHDSPEAAAYAYLRKATELFGEFARGS